MKKTILTIVTFISLLFTTALVSANYNFTAKDTQLINALTQKVEQVISEKGEKFRTPLVEGINKLSLQYKKNTRVSNILKQVSNNIDNSFEKDFEKILGNVHNNDLKTNFFIEKNTNKDVLYGNVEGKKILIDSLKHESGENNYINIFGYSPKNVYLIYGMCDYMACSIKLYNIKMNTIIDLSIRNSSKYGMDKNEKYIYVCRESGMSWSELYILKGNNFQEKQDLLGNNEVYNCGEYNQISNSFSFVLIDQNGKKQSYEYSFEKDIK